MWCVKNRECSELLYDRRYSLKLKGAVYKSYVRPAILNGSETWWQKRLEFYEFYRKIHAESNVWITAERQKNIYGFDVHVRLE